MSHRGREFMSIHEEALLDLRELLDVPASHRILFLQGGGLGENAIVPMNMLGSRKTADFVITGSWSQRSFNEARKYCAPHIAASGETAAGFTRAPARAEWRLSDDPAYVHLCTNETIHGIETFEIPDLGDIPLVADVSSHILSRPLDVAKFGVLFGGAQKNIGMAGVTVVIVREEDRRREQFAVQHAAHLCDLHRGPRLQVAEEAGRTEGDRSAQHREIEAALRRDRFKRFLLERDRARFAFADECAVLPRGRVAQP
jgi:phosphoserine aminotransferase